MILVIDNYDSFTYNLVQYLGELGTQPFVRRNNEITLDEIASLKPERIVISPGPGRPEQAGITLDVIKTLRPDDAAARRVPRASGDRHGVRRRGGPRERADARQDVQHQPRRPGRVCRHRDARSPWRAITRSSSIGRDGRSDLEISAQTEDDGTVMALRHRQFPIHGVQFHPGVDHDARRAASASQLSDVERLMNDRQRLLEKLMRRENLSVDEVGRRDGAPS